jgi:hypothetical protein
MLSRNAFLEFYNKTVEVSGDIQLDPTALTASANTVVWNPGSDTTDTYLIEFNVVNAASTDSIVYVGIDLAATGTLTQYFFRNYIPTGHQTGWCGPFVLAGDDDFMAWVDAGTFHISMRAKKVTT